MKKILTLSLLFIASLSFGQHVIIEAGPTFLKNYKPGINGGVTFLIKGFGIGVEAYKIEGMPIGVPVFARGVMVLKNNVIINLQGGYMFMNQDYEGKKLIGGTYAKAGIGYQYKKVHVLANLTGIQISGSLNPGANIMLGIRI